MGKKVVQILNYSLFWIILSFSPKNLFTLTPNQRDKAKRITADISMSTVNSTEFGVFIWALYELFLKKIKEIVMKIVWNWWKHVNTFARVDFCCVKKTMIRIKWIPFSVWFSSCVYCIWEIYNVEYDVKIGSEWSYGCYFLTTGFGAQGCLTRHCFVPLLLPKLH